jgi:hypothetical protein
LTSINGENENVKKKNETNRRSLDLSSRGLNNSRGNSNLGNRGSNNLDLSRGSNHLDLSWGGNNDLSGGWGSDGDRGSGLSGSRGGGRGGSSGGSALLLLQEVSDARHNGHGGNTSADQSGIAAEPRRV